MAKKTNRGKLPTTSYQERAEDPIRVEPGHTRVCTPACVDTVLSASPPATPTGDLATRDASSIGSTVVIAEGCVVPGDGGGGTFYWDPASEEMPDGGTIIQPVGTTTGRWKRVVTGPYNVKWFGARGDIVAGGDITQRAFDAAADDSEAFRCAIEAVTPVAPPTGPWYRTGPKLYVPPGRYKLTQTLVISRQIVIEGASGAGGWPSSTLVFLGDVPGIEISSDTRTTVPPPPGGAFSVIQDLAIVAVRKMPSADATLTTGHHGIVLQARALIERCYIHNFGDCGIFIRGVEGETNAIGWSIRWIHVILCGSDALRVTGNTSGGGICIGLDAMQNGGWGVYAAGLIGGTYIGCQVASNAAGGYCSEHGNVFLGCYAEADQVSHFGSPSVVLGGTFGAAHPFDPSTNALRLFHTERCSPMEMVWPDADREPTPHEYVRSLVGLQDGSLTAFGWQSGSERALGPGPWDAVWRLVFGKPANGWWGLTEGPINANAVPALAFAGATTNSRGNAWLPRGFYMGQLGGTASRIFINVAALRPTGGGTQGDIVFNKNAAVGQPMGWVYDGTQWRDLPNIT